MSGIEIKINSSSYFFNANFHQTDLQKNKEIRSKNKFTDSVL